MSDINLLNFEKYLRFERELSDNTVKSYMRDLKIYIEYLYHSESSVRDANKTLILTYLVQLQKDQKSTATISRNIASIRSLYQYLLNEGEIRKDPTINLKTPKKEKKIPEILSLEEVEIFLCQPDTETSKGVRDRAMLELLYATGMRSEEIITLEDDNVDISSNTLLVHGKGNKERMIPFGESTRLYLLKYLDVRNQEIENRTSYLFVRKNGQKMYARMVYAIVNKHLSGIKTLSIKSPHVLRHSFATAMLNNGAEINAIKNLLGHASLSSTQIYTHVTFKELKKVYDNAHPRA